MNYYMSNEATKMKTVIKILDYKMNLCKIDKISKNIILWFQLSLETLKVQEIPSGFDPEEYKVEILYINT